MVFNDEGGLRRETTLVISQPAHALISGQILRAWAEPLHESVVLAGGQHDVAWLDWELAPTFDSKTGRPHFFRDIGAAQHAPMWDRGVGLAQAAWGRRVALMISRHGSTIYERFSDRHRSAGGDARSEDDKAAQDYLRRHGELQGQWARALGLDGQAVALDSDLLAFADTVSLILCGAIPAPPQVEVAGRSVTLTAVPDAVDTYQLAPWPFAPDEIVFETEARALPPSGRFADAAAMQVWLADPKRIVARSSVRR